MLPMAKEKWEADTIYKAIDEYLEKGLWVHIEEKIREMGYEGSSSTVRDYITDWKKRRKNITIKVGKMGQKQKQ